MKGIGRTYILILATFGLAFFASACDPGSPYRTGVLETGDGGLTVFYADCGGGTRLLRVAVARSGEKSSPIWEVRSANPEGSSTLEVIVGRDQPSFETTVALIEEIGEGRYVVIVDSSSKTGSVYSFERRELRDGTVLAGNGDHYSPEAFRNGALC